MLVRGLTSTIKVGDPASVSQLVCEALSSGYAGDAFDDWVLDAAQCVVKDISGHGGSKTFQVSTGSAAVCVQWRPDDHDSLLMQRIEAAAKVLHAHGLAPRRISQGPNWSIDAWVAGKTASLQTHDDCARFGRLVAAVHALPTSWFDDYRARLIAACPALAGAPNGSHVWCYAARSLKDLSKFINGRSRRVFDAYAHLGPERRFFFPPDHSTANAGGLAPSWRCRTSARPFSIAEPGATFGDRHAACPETNGPALGRWRRRLQWAGGS